MEPLSKALQTVTTSLQSSETERQEVQNLRYKACNTVIAKWVAISGGDIEDKVLDLYLNELTYVLRISEPELKAAEQWILYGDPAKFKRLVLADFTPTFEQMEQVRFKYREALQSEYRRGYQQGLIDGRVK